MFTCTVFFILYEFVCIDIEIRMSLHHHVLIHIFIRYISSLYLYAGTKEEDSTQEEGCHQEEAGNKEEGSYKEEGCTQEEDHQEEIKCLL